MKICRFRNNNQEQYGALHNNRVFPFPDTKEFGDVSELIRIGKRENAIVMQRAV
jgi:hypothetical protein